MASASHQFIMGLVIKKMRDAGCRIVAVDGKYPGLLGEERPLPPQVVRHRPDIVGVRDGKYCLGEAKTRDDATSRRTREQVDDFVNAEVAGSRCEVYVGLPQSAQTDFERTLTQECLDRCENLHLIYVPDEIIND